MSTNQDKAIKKIKNLGEDEPYMITVTYWDKEASEFTTSVYSDLPVEQYDISQKVISELIEEQKNYKVQRLINASN
jgi:hypothetical protein